MIEDLIFFLADKFPEHEWDLDFHEGVQKYCILVNNFEFYKSKKYNNILKVLRKKYDVEFFCVYKNFSYE